MSLISSIMHLDLVIHNICTLQICLDIHFYANMSTSGLNNLYKRECLFSTCLMANKIEFFNALNLTDEKYVPLEKCPVSLVCDEDCFQPAQPM